MDRADAAAVGAVAWDVDESYFDMLPAAHCTEVAAAAQHTAAGAAAPASSNRRPAGLPGSSTPANAPPAAAPAGSFEAGPFTPSVPHGAGAGSSTPYGCTPLPATMFKQARGCGAGFTPAATPGGLEGHFTAMVTPGGPSWPQGMPAGGLVPYSITPPAGGRTVARTAVPQPFATPAADGVQASRVGAGCARSGSSTPPAAAVGLAGRSNSNVGSGGMVGPNQGAAAAAGGGGGGDVVGRSCSSTPPAATEGPAGRSSSGQVGADSQGGGLAPGDIVVSRSRSITPGSDVEGGCGASSEPGSRSRTPGRTPQSAAKHAALAAQLQVRGSERLHLARSMSLVRLMGGTGIVPLEGGDKTGRPWQVSRWHALMSNDL